MAKILAACTKSDLIASHRRQVGRALTRSESALAVNRYVRARLGSDHGHDEPSRLLPSVEHARIGLDRGSGHVLEVVRERAVVELVECPSQRLDHLGRHLLTARPHCLDMPGIPASNLQRARPSDGLLNVIGCNQNAMIRQDRHVGITHRLDVRLGD